MHIHRKSLRISPETLGRMIDEDFSLLKLTRKTGKGGCFLQMCRHPMQSNKEHKDSGNMTKSKEQNVSPATNLKEIEIYIFLNNSKSSLKSSVTYKRIQIYK